MDEKPTYDELMQKVKRLEKELGKFNLMEQAFLESEVIYCNLVERADDGIIIVQESVIKKSNPLFAKMSGYASKLTKTYPFALM